MDWALLLVLQVMSWPSLSALFTVEADQSTYEADFHGDVIMGCRFQPVTSNPVPSLKVMWQRLTPSFQEVYRMESGVENLVSQDPAYQGRVRLLTEELDKGWAKLQVSRLRINDSGTYRCLVQMGGADYITINLSIKAPYKTVTKRIQKSTEGDEVELTCQSEGYPFPSVTWRDGNLQRLSSNTTAVETPDQLFLVTSQIQVRFSDRNNYTCSFTDGGASAMFDIPDEIPKMYTRNDALIISLSAVVVVVVCIAVFSYRRQKGSRYKDIPSTRNNVFDSERDPPAATTAFNSDDKENLKEFLKAQYRSSLNKEVRHHWDTFCQQELPHRLQNSEGQPVNLQALLPEAGETLLLEGLPRSGKTTLAQILVSSWAEGLTHALSKPPELNVLHLLLFVDCGDIKGDMFQEIITQCSLGEKIPAEDDLTTVLSGPNEVLLLLDGYREGNEVWDESLQRFLREKHGCRVLVMARPGHCPKLKGMVGTGGVLKLQTETEKRL